MNKNQKYFKEIIKFRQEKLNNIKRAGYNPYAYNFHKTHEIKSLLDKGGFICCGWDGSVDSEMAIKLETKATIRCIISNKPPKGKNCIYSGRPAKYEVVYAKSY